MRKRFLCFLLSLFFCNFVHAQDYSYYYNQSTKNEKTLADFSNYMENLHNKIQKNWITPDFLEDGHLQVLFKLDREGYVISGDILESSGNSVFDESAINAIQKSEPFGKFPEATTKEFITINYSFDTTLIKTDKIKDLYNKAKQYTYSDKNLALKYINEAISEVGEDIESYFLYKRRGKIKEAIGDYIGAKEDFVIYEKFKKCVDIKRIHLLRHQAEQDDSAFIYYYLAYAYEEIKDYDNAIWAINKAIERTDLNQHYKRYRTELIKLYEH